MAAFGFASDASLARPFETDRPQRVYVIDDETARVALEALDRFDDRYGGAA